MSSQKQSSASQNDMAAIYQMSLLSHLLSTTRLASPQARPLLSKSQTIRRKKVATSLHPSSNRPPHKLKQHSKNNHRCSSNNHKCRCRCKARDKIHSLRQTRLNSPSTYKQPRWISHSSHSNRTHSAMKTTQRKRFK